MDWHRPDLGLRIACYFYKPITLVDAPIAMRHATQIGEAAGVASDWPGFLGRAPILCSPDEVQGDFEWLHPIATSLCSWDYRTLRVHFRGLTDRHLAAAVLALRAYTADHSGEPPAELEQLIPIYLPNLPTDPMAAAGRTLGYRWQGADPVVYSVGDDGTDNNANDQPSPGDYLPLDPSYRRWQMRDVVVHLQRQPRPRATHK